jgi:RNA polymerase sigma factor (sigma-70 family)
MTGSVMDGEDLVQEALFQAYRKLDTFDDDRPLAPWLFRIAHNRCIDFLRRRDVRQEAEAEAASNRTRHSIVRLEVADRRIVRIVEYAHCPWILPAALSVLVAHPS